MTVGDVDAAVERPAPSRAWALAGEVFRLATAAATFLVVGRSLGADGFGLYAGTLAVVTALSHLSNCGASHVLVQRLAGGAEPVSVALPVQLLVPLVAGVACTAAVLVAAPWLLPSASVLFVASLAASELVLRQVSEVVWHAHLGLHDLRRGAWVRLLGGGTRCAAALGFLVAGSSSTTGWAVLHLVSAVVAAAASLWVLRRRTGPWLWSLPRWQDARRGFPFVLGLTSWQVQEDADKYLLLRLGGGSDAGVYAAAYRLVMLAGAPVRAVNDSSYPRYFEAGRRSVAAAARVGRDLLWWMFGAGVIAAVGSVGGVWLFSGLLGGSFGELLGVVVLLAPLPLAAGLVNVVGNVLTGCGRVELRSRVQFAAMVLNVGLNLILVPSAGWHGAIAATYASAALSIVLMGGLARGLHRGEVRVASVSASVVAPG